MMRGLALITVLLLTTCGVALAALPPAGSGTITLDQPLPVALGDSITFTTSYPGHLKNPRVVVSCYQDVNLDGTTDTTILGPDIVYSESDSPDATFTLGGFSSIWNLPVDQGGQGGGPAECRADLLYFKTDTHEWNSNGQQDVVFLGSTTFHSEG